jgi:hypothetical protein
MTEPLTGQELRILTWIEMYWHVHKEFPSVEAFKKEYPKIDYLKFLGKQSLQRALSNRGIEIAFDGAVCKNGLTDTQIAAILTVVNVADKRSFNMKLKTLGVTPTRWSGWMKDKKFKEFYTSTAGANFEEALPRVQDGLLRAAEQGIPSAVKLYMDLTGRTADNDPTIRNLKLAITKLIESVQNHVKDPEILRRIEADFMQISKNEEPEVHPAVRQIANTI